MCYPMPVYIIGTYYNTLAKLLNLAVEGTLTRESLYETVRQHGFEESILTRRSCPQHCT